MRGRNRSSLSSLEERVKEGRRSFVEETQPVADKDHDILRKKVTKLMKQQKLQQVNLIVKEHDDLKPWGQEAHVKGFVFHFLSIVSILVPIIFQLGCGLVQLLMETAYIQPPVDELGDGPVDICPAFVLY
ncbi:DNA-directed RNA polymerase 1B [Cucumis melo var. makuwa]|uniref:DNA-directed RNA polymerase 1B n=1 Tax=Cucumis melo var. makuwa TaxID=1194695 RepID=A0A5D3DS53_CUCMM|nr:DNA-directed RNA polymerase 1B [Cucumis melo var. makuwa]TYK26338.1 DNA-directed RNA polymerase 1B [Cucumis melo var. makuwa]